MKEFMHKVVSALIREFELPVDMKLHSETERMNGTALAADIACLSSKQDCDRRDIDRLLREIESLRQRTESIENELLKEKMNSVQERTDLEALKASVSKLTPPRAVGGFKSHETIHNTVPGCSPLSEGIISHLRKVCGGHVCDHQRVHVFSDSTNGSNPPRNAADLTTNSIFHSAISPNQSYGYDFKDNQLISPTHYAIRSRSDCGIGSSHPKSWVIEVTNDRSKESAWIEIDRRENNHDLNGPGIVQVFQCSNPQDGEFRYIRLRQIGANHYGNNSTAFTAFEVFGQLRMRNSVPI
jgi:hypothetical protein